MSHGDSISVLEITPKRQVPQKHYCETLQEDRISDEAASSVTGDEPATMMLAKVDDSSDVQYSSRQTDDNLDDTADRESAESAD